MKKFGIILLILGLLVAVAGYVVQDKVENHEDIKQLNASLTLLGQNELTPEFIMELLKGDVKIMGQTVDPETIINEFAAEDADKIMLGMNLYAYSPLMMKIGLIVAGVGLLLAIFGPRKKKQSYARYA